MLLRRSRLLTPPQPAEDPILSQQRSPRRSLHLDHLRLINLRFGWYGIEIQIFSEHDDTGTILQHVAGGARNIGGICRSSGRSLGGRRDGGWGRGGDGLGDGAEEVEHVLEGGGIVLEQNLASSVNLTGKTGKGLTSTG